MPLAVGRLLTSPQVFLTVFRVLLGIRDADEEGMVAPLQIASEFLDLLDPDKVADQLVITPLVI